MKACIQIVISLILTEAFVQTLLTDTNQVSCQFGHFQTQSGSCVECLTSCAKCNNLSAKCEQCTEGYKLNRETGACQQCPKGQLSCEKNEPIKCQRYYRLQYKKCELKCIIQNCQYCESIHMKECLACYSGFEIDENKNGCVSVSSKNRYLQRINQSSQQKNIRNGAIILTKNQIPSSAEANPNQVLNNQSIQSNKSNSAIVQWPTLAAVTPWVLTDQSCPNSMYVDKYKNQECSSCGFKCATCINSPDQCLDCAQNRVKLGWKCITAEHLSFYISVIVPRVHQVTALSQSLNSFKSQLIGRILPVSYRSMDTLTLVSYEYNQDLGSLKLNGVVDILPTVDSSKVKEEFLRATAQGSKISDYYLVEANVSEVKPKLNGNRKIGNQTNGISANSSSSSVSQQPKPENKPVDLALILTPIIFGSVFLLLLVSIPVCSVCCRKKYDQTDLRISKMRSDNNHGPATQRMIPNASPLAVNNVESCQTPKTTIFKTIEQIS